MTREEAINMLHGMRADNLNLDDLYIKDKYEALGMAIKALEQEPCEDAISRAEAIRIASGYCHWTNIPEELAKLPSVQPKQKTGHGIMIDKELQRYKCSECGEVIRLYKKSKIPKLEKDETISNYPFSHCGCRMIEPQESEE